MRPPSSERTETVTTFEVLALIHRYRPRREPMTTYWDQGLRDLALEHLPRLEYPSLNTFKDRFYLFTQVTAFSLSEGCPPDIEELWHPDRVGRYLAVHPQRSGVRSGLVGLGRQLTRHAPWPPPQRPRNDRPKHCWKPYTDTEMDRFWHLSARQSTPTRRRRARAMLALGYGAGVASTELPWVTAADIEVTDTGLWVVIGDPHPRRIPVLTEAEDVLADLCVGLEPTDYLTGRRPEGFTRATRSWLLDAPNTARANRPRISPARLRATWIYRHLQRGAPLGDVMTAAGHVDGRTLDHIIRHLQPLPPDQHEQLLRGATHARP